MKFISLFGFAGLYAMALMLELHPLAASQDLVTATPNLKYRVLYAFPGQEAPEGAVPAAGVITDGSGNVYGTTIDGGHGAYDGCPCGVVFKVNSQGTETVLYNFGGYRTDAVAPFAPLVRDAAGNLYGTTDVGGDFGEGTVYKLDNSSQESLLYSFTGGADGAQPFAGLFRDPSGALYGTTFLGGAATSCDGIGGGCGVVFKVTRTGKETVLHSFTGGADGRYPETGVIRDAAGNLYGATLATHTKYGTVYKLSKGSNENVLHTFAGGRDGKWPQFGNLIRDKAGNLYGATNNGGASNLGVLFRVTTSGKFTALYNFTGGTDGSNPMMPLVRDSAGNFYGVTASGGDAHCNCGTLFKLDNANKLTVLHTFTSGADGAYPVGGLAGDSTGALYGATQWGGNPSVQCGSFTTGCGTVFKLTP